MLFRTFLVALIAFAAPSLALAAVPAASIEHALARRQVSIGLPSPLPSQCASTCSPVNNEVSLVSVYPSLAGLSSPRRSCKFPPSMTATDSEPRLAY